MGRVLASRETTLALVSVGGGLILWEFFVRAFGVRPQLLPAPSTILVALGESLLQGSLIADVQVSLVRLAAGLAAGSLAGIGVGFLIAWYERLRALLRPLIAFAFTTPRIALIPLLIIWFGSGDGFKIVLVTLGVFFIMVMNTVVGVEGIPTSTVLAARNLGANDWQIFKCVVFPGSLPIIFGAFRICYSLGLISVVAAEMLVSQNGLGHYIAIAGETLRVDNLFAGLAISGVLGLLGYRAIDVAERLTMPWRPRIERIQA